jgi:DNA polymerase-1
MNVLEVLCPNKKNILVDADLYLYQATVASEETICWSEEEDIWSLRADLKQAKRSFCERLEGFKERLGSDTLVLCFTGKGNFRKTVYEPYKSNRKKTRKPVGYAHMVEWAKEAWPSITRDLLEADDLLEFLSQWPSPLSHVGTYVYGVPPLFHMSKTVISLGQLAITCLF